MFVPCKLVDGVWVVLEEPEMNRLFGYGDFNNEDEKEYQEAKERVLFEGFKLSTGKEAVIYKKESEDLIIRMHKEYKLCSVNGKQVVKIEELVKYNLQLTESAKKQIGL